MAIQLDKLSDSVWVLHDGTNSIAEIDGTNNVIRLNGTIKVGSSALVATGAASTTEIETLAGGTAVKKFSQTVPYASFTDGGAAVGTFEITAGTVPAGAHFLCALVTAVTGFAGDTSAALIIGDGTDTDRYNTSTVDVFATAAAGVAAGLPSGVQYHDVAKSPILTITKAADWGAGTSGSVTVEFYYLT